jgi:cell division protein DivIC
VDRRSKEKIRHIQSNYQKIVAEREKLVSHRRRGLVRRLAAFGIILSFTGYFMISTFFSQNTAFENKLEEKKQLESNLEIMQKKQGKLEEEIVKLNDDEYIAKIARRDYFLSDDNEIIFSVPTEDDE